VKSWFDYLINILWLCHLIVVLMIVFYQQQQQLARATGELFE